MTLRTKTTHSVGCTDGEFVLSRINGDVETAISGDTHEFTVLEDSCAGHTVISYAEGYLAVSILCVGRSVELKCEESGIPVGEHLVVGKGSSLLGIEDCLESTTM